jgi:hypothetical protein
MLPLKASIVAIVLATSITATAGITYVATRMSVAVSCPAPVAATAPPLGRPALPPGDPVQPSRGKQW